MSPNICMRNTQGFIALAFTAFLLTSACAAPSRPGIAKRPPAQLKLDQVDSVTAMTELTFPKLDSVTGTKRTVAPGKIEYPNARAKGGDAVKWAGPDLDAAKAPGAKTAKALSGDEAGTLKGMRSQPAPGSANAAVNSSGSSPPRKATAQFNPKELAADKRK